MAYTINLTDGAIFATIPDGTIDTSSSMILVGKNYAGYGEFLDENFIHLLENGANNVAPGAPLTGQLWYDKSTNQMKMYTGTAFKIISGATNSGTAPTNNVVGDLWWDTVNNQLRVWNGSEFTLVGPATTAGAGTSGAIVTTVTDNTATQHVIVQLYVDDTIVGIVSKDATFTPQTAISGFATISPGIQLSTTVPSALFRGTATNAQTLETLAASAFMRTNTNTSTSGTLGVINDAGLTVGLDQDAKISVTTANSEVILQNQTQDANLVLRVNDGGTATNAISINGASAEATFTNPVNLPAITKTGSNGVGNIGSTTSRFNTVFATTFEGTVANATNVTGTVAAANGGTGRNTLNANSVLIGAGTGAVTFVAPGTSGNVLKSNGTTWVSEAGSGGGGTVTSVGLTAPTGFSVSGSPVTGSGSLGLTFASGYSLPTTTSQANWDTAYTDRLKWDGGSSGLNASTGRTSLGLGTMATEATTSYVSVAGNQTGSGNITGAKEFTGGLISTNFNFDVTSSIYKSGSNVRLDISSINVYAAGNPTGTAYLLLDNSVYGIQSSGGDFQWGEGGGTFGTIVPGIMEINTADCRKPSGGTWNASTSDARTKTDVEDYTKGLSAVAALRPVTYRYNDVTSLGRSTNYAQFVGLIAQEVEQTDLNNMVMDSGEGFLTVDTSELTYTLINAIKELKAEVDQLRTELDTLKNGA